MKQNDVQRMLDIMGGGYEFNKTYWPYVVTISYDQYYNAERWCYEHFKSRNWRNQGMRYFAFKRKEDYEWFLLRWA